MDEPKYKCDFLWPCEDGSLDQMLYELANARTEEYRKVWCDNIRSRLAGLTEANEALSKRLAEKEE